MVGGLKVRTELAEVDAGLADGLVDGLFEDDEHQGHVVLDIVHF